MYKDKVLIKIRCDKHPHYDPDMGEGAIRGGCVGCTTILQIAKSVEKLKKVLNELQLHD